MEANRLLRVSVLAGCVMLVQLHTSREQVLSGRHTDALVRRLVFVTDDDAQRATDGCDAISVIDLDTGEAVAYGEQHVSPGRLAATSDGSLVVSVSNNSGLFVYLLRQLGNAPSGWETVRIDDVRLVEGGQPAITPDDRFLLLPMIPGVEKYDVTKITPLSLGAPLGRYSVQAAELEIAHDSATAYVVGADGYVHVVDIDTMTQVGAPIPYENGGGPVGFRVRRTFTALSPDGRYLVVNRYNSSQLNIIDLQARTSHAVSLGAPKET